MGIGVGIFLIVLGAILTFALDATVAGLDLKVVGWVLMLAGVAGLILFFYFWNRRRAPAAAVMPERAPATVVPERAPAAVVPERARATVVTERRSQADIGRAPVPTRQPVEDPDERGRPRQG